MRSTGPRSPKPPWPPPLRSFAIARRRRPRVGSAASCWRPCSRATRRPTISSRGRAPSVTRSPGLPVSRSPSLLPGPTARATSSTAPRSPGRLRAAASWSADAARRSPSWDRRRTLGRASCTASSSERSGRRASASVPSRHHLVTIASPSSVPVRRRSSCGRRGGAVSSLSTIPASISCWCSRPTPAAW